MLTVWKIAMICALPLMWDWSRHRGVLLDAKIRTWAVLMLGSVASIFVPFNYLAYASIDLLTGAVVLSRPAGEAQKAIGTICAGMAICSIGFWAGGAGQPGAFAEFLSLLGWLQFAILLGWAIHDNFRHRFRRPDVRRRVSTTYKGRV